jgi:hypothetical protein
VIGKELLTLKASDRLLASILYLEADLLPDWSVNYCLPVLIVFDFFSAMQLNT